MLEAGAVDVLQIDGTRCAGITEFLRAAALAASHHLKVSAHTAPTLHAHVCCAVPNSVHVEYFHDHARIEQMLFEGAIPAVDGELRPGRDRSGLGIDLKRADAERYAA
jgi:L-alanine-DL-glutamate epimerase-like enolase superfamily enzyme